MRPADVLLKHKSCPSGQIQAFQTLPQRSIRRYGPNFATLAYRPFRIPLDYTAAEHPRNRIFLGPYSGAPACPARGAGVCHTLKLSPKDYLSRNEIHNRLKSGDHDFSGLQKRNRA